MIITRDTDAAASADAFSMDSIHDMGVGASWVRIRPGASSHSHQHDESEVFVFVKGSGELLVNGERHKAGPGTVVRFAPFETHVIENTGDTDLMLLSFYWRDPDQSARSLDGVRRRFDGRPVFVFSTPPTPNGDLHLGHLSGPYLGADVFVRFQRMNGTSAWHLTGSDDFQSYVVTTAAREGRTPAEAAAYYSAEILQTLRLMDIVPDQYTVTSTNEDYQAGLRRFFSRLVTSGAVREHSGPALFDAETGGYLYEVDVAGRCPRCGARTGGNICEDCGEPNTCVDLVEPTATGSAAAPAPRLGDVARYSIALHDFRADIEAHHHLGRVPTRLRELADRVFRRPRLEIAVTHPAPWGVRPAEDTDGEQVIWAWPEMAFGFLYDIEALGRRLGHRWQADQPQPDWKIVHFFGFDNSFYHSILYPALYKAAFPDWNPDIDYNVNEFYLLDGGKFSTSRRHAIWGKEILGPDSVDAIRCYLSRTRPEAVRTNFERGAYESYVRTVLQDGWQRWLSDLGSRVSERFGGQAPDAGIWTPEHTAFLARLSTRLTAVTRALSPDEFSLNHAVRELEGLVEDATAFAGLEETTARIDGWHDESRTAIALELAAARLLARCAAPIMPRFAARLAAALGEEQTDGGRSPEWPRTVELVPPETRITLSGEVFFAVFSPDRKPVPA